MPTQCLKAGKTITALDVEIALSCCSKKQIAL